MTLLRSRRFAVLAVVLVAGFALGACSSDKKSGPTKTVTNGEITVDAHDIGFDVQVIKTSAGPLTITLDNTGALEHTLKVDGTDFELKAGAGEKKSGTVTLSKGTYDFECTIAGHAQQGMKGTIEVS